MSCGILHPMVWGTSVKSLLLILQTINLFLPWKLIFWKATKVGGPPNFPKLMSQLWGIPQPQFFVTSLLEPHPTYFWKHYIYRKEGTKVGSQNLATNFWCLLYDIWNVFKNKNFGYQIWFCTRLVRGIYQTLVDSPHKGTVLQKLFPCHDTSMSSG